MKFGDWMTLQMNIAGLNGPELAKRLGVSESSISDWENNNRLPTIINLIGICEVFGIELDRNPTQLVFEIVTQIDEFKWAMERWKKRK